MLKLEIFLSVMITERSFSNLKWIKNELRHRMTPSRLNNLSLMNINNEILTVGIEELINDFANLKCRNRIL